MPSPLDASRDLAGRHQAALRQAQALIERSKQDKATVQDTYAQARYLRSITRRALLVLRNGLRALT